MSRVVEKLWKSLRESLWGNCGKKLWSLWKKMISTILGVDLHIFRTLGERFADGFAHLFFPVVGWFCTFSTEPITTTTNILIKE